jgi:hypothetical protein
VYGNGRRKTAHLFLTEHYALRRIDNRRVLYLPDDEQQFLVSRFNQVLRPIVRDESALRKARRIQRHVEVSSVAPADVDLDLRALREGSETEGDEMDSLAAAMPSPESACRALRMHSETHRAVVRGTVLSTRVPEARATCLDAYREYVGASKPYDWGLKPDEVIAAGKLEVLSRSSQQMRTEVLLQSPSRINDLTEKDEYPGYPRVIT